MNILSKRLRQAWFIFEFIHNIKVYKSWIKVMNDEEQVMDKDFRHFLDLKHIA